MKLKTIDPTLPDSTVTMSPRRRQLMQDVFGDHVANAATLHYLYAEFPDDRLDLALRWLSLQGLRGRRFEEWFHDKCKGSRLELHRKLTAAVERKDERALFAKDFN